MIPKTFTIAILALMAALLPVQAAIHGAAVIQIPYSVELQNKVLPPGEYWVRDVEVAGYDTKILNLYKSGGQEFVASVQAVPAYRMRPTQDNKVEFREAGNGNHELHKIWIAFNEWGYEIPPNR